MRMPVVAKEHKVCKRDRLGLIPNLEIKIIHISIFFALVLWQSAELSSATQHAMQSRIWRKMGNGVLTYVRIYISTYISTYI